MFENLDELIHHNLNLIFNSDNQVVLVIGFKDLNNKSLSNSNRLYEIMERHDLVFKQADLVSLTEKGYVVCKNGGWLEVVRLRGILEKKERLEEELREKTEMALAEKAVHETTLVKWKLKTFWPIFFFACVGFVLSVYNFISSLSSVKHIKQTELRIQQMESELSKQRTSSSSHKKDTLSRSSNSSSKTLNLSSSDSIK